MSRWREVLRGGFGRGVFPHEFWFLLELPGRVFVQSPARLAHRLALSRTSRVLEVGPGSGFFSVDIARSIPEGHLALLDLQPEFLVRACRKLAKAGLANVSCTPGNACNMPFPDHDFDVVVFVTVLGEIADRASCLREVFRVLKPGGLLSITELRFDPDFVHSTNVRQLAALAGFESVATWGPRWSYTAHFRKPKPHQPPNNAPHPAAAGES